MGSTAQPDPAPKATTNGPFTSFADMVDYRIMYAELARRGITLTEDEKKRCEKICSDSLRNHDGGRIIGNSIGGAIQNIAYTLLAFVQKLFTGDFGGGLSDLVSNVGSTVSGTAEQSKLWQLQHDVAELAYPRLKAAGGNLARAAEYITGVKPFNDNSPNENLNASIMNQVGKSINLPVDTDTSLNPRHVAYADGPGNLPPRPSTGALTRHG